MLIKHLKSGHLTAFFFDAMVYEKKMRMIYKSFCYFYTWIMCFYEKFDFSF